MEFALTTRWNAGRHTDGEAMLEEILELGFHRVELGYDLRIDLVPGVKKLVEAGAVTVDSVHNFCPVPVGAPRGHPELFTLGSRERRVHEGAVLHTGNTIRFAAEIGASVVVTHAGNVDMPHYTRDLIRLAEEGKQFTAAYEKRKLKLQVKRDKKAPAHLDALRSGLERLLPVLEDAGVTLAIENLPTWEALPLETELERLLEAIGSDRLAYWHDIGHAQIRENLGFINHERWLERLRPRLAGMHVHDVAAPALDHLMPPRGDIRFERLRPFARDDILRVIEPTPRTPPEDLPTALDFLASVWDSPDEAPDTPPTRTTTP